MNEIYQRVVNWENWNRNYRRVPRMVRYRENRRYYDGLVFDGEEFVQQPLAINIVQLVCETHASYLWGQWEPQGTLVSWMNPFGRNVREAEAIVMWAASQFGGFEDVLQAAGLNQSVYGDAVLMPVWDEALGRVMPMSISPESLYAAWSFDSLAMREAILSYSISPYEAEQRFGVAVRGATATYWEHWTDAECSRYIGSELIDRFEHDSPGILPIIHIPNTRIAGEFYGQGDAEPIHRLQDELNRRVADYGDIVAYASHPIITVSDYYGKVEDLRVGPDEVWDLGRSGKASYLGMEGRLPVDIARYIDYITSLIQDLSGVPPAALGRHQASFSSGIALAMLMAPLIQRVNWKRMAFGNALRRYLRIAAMIEDAHGVLPFSLESILNATPIPQFAPILPKDRTSTVYENVSLVSNGLRTIARALEDLGEHDPARQAEEIIDEIRRKVELGIMKPMRPPSSPNMQIGGKNAPGSAGMPDIGPELRDATRG